MKKRKYFRTAVLVIGMFALSGCSLNGGEKAEAARERSSSQVSMTEAQIMAVVQREENGETDQTGSSEQLSENRLFEYESQELYAKRGENQIYGVIYVPKEADRPMPTVIYAHGYVVYCFDFCGGGNGSKSDGSPLEMSIFTEQEDLEAVIDMIGELEYVDRENLFLFGASQGGLVAGITAASNAESMDGEVLGNCQYIARLIEQSTGGDLFAIETVQEYPGTHEPLLDFAWEEKAENARPQLASQIETLEDYNIIFLGYPNWNADLPMPLYTFLEEYDFSGKTIIPFSTHGGSGFSRTISTIADLQPGAEVLKDGLSISRNSVAGAADSVAQWVQGLNLADR